MERIEKTVFISYRRTNFYTALAIFQNLTQHGFDVFFDYKGIASGDFERVILGNIPARAHFLVLLTPSALECCNEPADWLRREIETALDNKRNIVPLMLEGFNFGTPKIASQLTGTLAALKHYNGLSIPPEYFDEAMERLRVRYLNVPLSAVLHPLPLSAQPATTEQKVAANAAPAVQERELTAQQWFEQGFAAIDVDEKLRFYSEAIRLKPDDPDAFINRAVALLDADDRLRPGFRTYLSPSTLLVAESNASEFIAFPSFDYAGVDVKLHVDVEHSVPTSVYHFHYPTLKIKLSDNTLVTNRTRLSLEEITSLVHIEGRFPFPVVIAPLSGFHGRIWHLRQQNPAREMRHYILVLLYGGANNGA